MNRNTTNSQIKWLKQLLLLLFLLAAYAQFVDAQTAQQQAKMDSLVAKIAVEKNDQRKIRLYTSLFWQYFGINPSGATPFIQEALNFADHTDLPAEEAELYIAAGRIYWRTGNFDGALKLHFEALSIYRQLKSESQITTVLFYIGQDYADQGNYTESLSYIGQAKERYQLQGRLADVAGCYLLFSFVYSKVGNLSEAARSNYEALKIFEKLDDNYYMAVTTSNLADQYVLLKRYDEAFEYYNKAINVLQHAGDLVNLSGLYLAIGQVYISLKKYDKAEENIYLALETGKKINDPYCKGQASEVLADLYQLRGEFQKALEYYLEAEKLYRSVSNMEKLALISTTIGNLYTHLKDFDGAKLYYDKTAAILDTFPSLPVLNNYYNGIQRWDSATGNWQNAYFHYRKYIDIRDSLNNEENSKASVQTIMQYEFDKKQAALNAEQEKKDIRQKNIRNSIAAGLAGALVFLIVVYRQRNRISKARKRSDELLLNILPEEVADELKENGTAKAKHFDEVTVLFTDFKNFTSFSENLSAQELVNEINFCYSAFDKIIDKYGIEKIKTIGDAYMCAGGLPVPNTTNAVDTVGAAMEILDFMLSEKSKREASGKSFFEIRIGCHTGPLVAGIVGIKKFAYDIWGDTVNIASRMESSGAVGRVNISDATYHLVKENFQCIYRGKIEAKNKGEIDMYYVEMRK